MRRFLTPRCLGLHLTLLVLLPIFAWLTDWQLGRALAGNTLSWAYTFEWPLFAGYAIYVWWQLVHDRVASVPHRSPISPPATGGQETGEDHDQPGWALKGGRRRNVAIAAGSAVEPVGGRGERFRPQTAEEAAELARYNRYLDGLGASDPGPARS